MLRALWKITWLILASWTPPQFYAWRRLLLNIFGAKIARGARVYGSATIWYPPNLEMKAGSVLGWKAHCYCMDRIVLDEFCVVSQFSHLVAGTHDTESDTFQLFTKPIYIGKHAWVAAGAFVGPGVTVHEGAVLGARGVAFKDLDAWSIYAGNPARFVRKRLNFVD